MASPIPSPASAFLKAPESLSDYLWTVPFECPAGPLNPSSPCLQTCHMSPMSLMMPLSLSQPISYFKVFLILLCSSHLVGDLCLNSPVFFNAPVISDETGNEQQEQACDETGKELTGASL